MYQEITLPEAPPITTNDVPGGDDRLFLAPETTTEPPDHFTPIPKELFKDAVRATEATLIHPETAESLNRHALELGLGIYDADGGFYLFPQANEGLFSSGFVREVSKGVFSLVEKVQQGVSDNSAGLMVVRDKLFFTIGSPNGNAESVVIRVSGLDSEGNRVDLAVKVNKHQIPKGFKVLNPNQLKTVDENRECTIQNTDPHPIHEKPTRFVQYWLRALQMLKFQKEFSKAYPDSPVEMPEIHWATPYMLVMPFYDLELEPEDISQIEEYVTEADKLFRNLVETNNELFRHTKIDAHEPNDPEKIRKSNFKKRKDKKIVFVDPFF